MVQKLDGQQGGNQRQVWTEMVQSKWNIPFSCRYDSNDCLDLGVIFGLVYYCVSSGQCYLFPVRGREEPQLLTPN
jgi:hypothetical protein